MSASIGSGQNDRSTVAKYPYFRDLRECLAHGWSCGATLRYFEWRYGLDGLPSQRALERWRKKHMSDTLIRENLMDSGYVVDVTEHLNRLIPILEYRIARGFQVEKRRFKGMLQSACDDAVRVYLDTLKLWVSVTERIGSYGNQIGASGD